MADGSGDIDAGVHEARKAMKRLRALLRMVRPHIGERAYKFENRSLRDVARLVSGVRDSAVAVETVVALANRFDGVLPVDVFDDVAERLDVRALRLRQRIIYETDAIDRVVSTLERTRIRFAGWPIGGDERKAYGSPLPEKYKSFGKGMAQTYGRGRSEMRQAFGQPTARSFHQWRKRVKYLRHQVEVVRLMWPEVLGGTAFALDTLGDVLGEEHDLADLLSLLATDPFLCPDPVERSLFAALAQHRRSELQTTSKILGIRLYNEKPDRFSNRLEAYWDSTQIEIPMGHRLE